MSFLGNVGNFTETVEHCLNLINIKDDGGLHKMEHFQNQTSPQSDGRTYPELVVPTTISEPEATYQAALKLVARIDDDLTRGVRHYRNKAGKLLMTLDEVVRAILENDLLLDEEREKVDTVWLPPQELAA